MPLVLFDLGFRPFFLLAPLYAVVCVGTLLGALCFGVWPDNAGIVAATWHGHEMVYGFVLAAIAGFLLTAVPNWTGTRPLSGAALVALVLIWFGGRVAMSPFIGVAPGPAALVDLAFVPALAAALAAPLVRARNYRNFGFLALLSLLFAGNVLFHNTRSHWFDVGSVDGLRVAIDTVVLVVAVVAGRIVPAFTRNALVRRALPHAIVPTPVLDAFAIAALIFVLAGDVVAPNSAFGIVAAAAAALLHFARVTRWQGWRMADEPIVWVLHIGYLWISVALALKALWLASAVPIAAYWMHALTAGAFGTMILGVMSRVALGHTGRALTVAPSIAIAYVLVSLGAAIRIFVAPLLPAHYVACVAIGGSIWLAAFIVFVAVYAPILIGPRIDAPPPR